MVTFAPFLWRRDQQFTEEEEAAWEAAEAEKRKLKILQRPKAKQEKPKPKVRQQADIQESLKHRQANYNKVRAHIFGNERSQHAISQTTARLFTNYRQYLKQAKESIITGWKAICPCISQKSQTRRG